MSLKSYQKLINQTWNKSQDKHRGFPWTKSNIYSHSSFTKRCTFIRTLIKIYIKIRWLRHVSVYYHHQGACNWAWL